MKRILLASAIAACFTVQAQDIDKDGENLDIEYSNTIEPICGLDVNEANVALTIDKDPERPAVLDIRTNRRNQYVTLTNFEVSYNLKDASFEQYIKIKVGGVNDESLDGMSSTARFLPVGDLKSYTIREVGQVKIAAKLDYNADELPAGNYSVTVSFDAICGAN